MRQLSAVLIGAAVLAGASLRGGAGEEGIVSSPGLEAGSTEIGGYFVAPAADVAGPLYSQDQAPSQVFEVIRPAMEAFRIGRLTTSCGCLSLSAEKRSFRRGERARLVLRNVKPAPADGARYAFFVQIADPPLGALQYDVFVASGGGPGTPPGRPAFPDTVQAMEAPAAPAPPETTGPAAGAAAGGGAGG